MGVTPDDTVSQYLLEPKTFECFLDHSRLVALRLIISMAMMLGCTNNRSQTNPQCICAPRNPEVDSGTWHMVPSDPKATEYVSAVYSIGCIAACCWQLASAQAAGSQKTNLLILLSCLNIYTVSFCMCNV